MKIIFATNNLHKAEEAGKILGEEFEVIRPSELGLEGDIPETHETIRDNSIEKARYVWDAFHETCFSDDTGLEVDALDGAPGVYSARFAGDDKDPAANRMKLLKELSGLPLEKRTARFKCVVSLIEDGRLSTFEGTCEGHIALAESEGVQGFGYDSIFIPDGLSATMAEITIEEKNVLSHRGKAMRLLKCHLSQNQG